MIEVKDYGPSMPYQWCPGCGDFGIVGSPAQSSWSP